MILFFDTETTGLAPGNVIQLAYILSDGKNVKGKNFYFYVPSIPPESTAVHGITVEKLRALSGGRVFSDYIDEIECDFANSNLIVAHNFPFDFKFMASEFENNGRIFHFKEKFDTMRYFTPYIKLPCPYRPGFKYPKLCELAEFFGISDREVDIFAEKLFFGGNASHDARFDTAQMYLSCMRASQKNEKFKVFLENYY